METSQNNNALDGQSFRRNRRHIKNVPEHDRHPTYTMIAIGHIPQQATQKITELLLRPHLRIRRTHPQMTQAPSHADPPESQRDPTATVTPGPNHMVTQISKKLNKGRCNISIDLYTHIYMYYYNVLLHASTPHYH